MASKEVLNQLYEVAKVSSVFKGMQEKDILAACEEYKDRPDDDIQSAIENIRGKDQEVVDKAEKQKAALEAGKERMVAMHSEEIKDREEEGRLAEEMLAELFN